MYRIEQVTGVICNAIGKKEAKGMYRQTVISQREEHQQREARDH